MPTTFTHQFLRVGQSTFAMERKESASDTLALAHFLASTGPEQFLKPSSTQPRPPRFLDRLRKPQAPPRKRPMAIPLPVIMPSHLPTSDSGVYTNSMPSETIHARSPPEFKLRSTQTDLACRHCHQPYNREKRLSCPSFLPTGRLLSSVRTSGDLRAMIEVLKAQLVQEQASRLQLEQAYSLLYH